MGMEALYAGAVDLVQVLVDPYMDRFVAQQLIVWHS
jgi:hypothetical protein